MEAGLDRRRTIRLQRSALLECRLGELDRPAVKIAETEEECHGAFRLLYGEYLRSGYTAPRPDGMLYSRWSLLPGTSIFVFKSYLDVVGTMSHIMDSPLFGLPMDAVYKDRIDELRAQGRRVAEVGALATLRERRWSNAMIYLSKALFQFARLSGVNDLVVMVNPKHVRFYTDILLFTPLGEQRDYDKVGAPAVALRADLDSMERDLLVAYGGNDFDTDLYTFFTKFSVPTQAGKDTPGGGQRLSGRRSGLLSPYAAHLLLSSLSEGWAKLPEAQRAYFTQLYHLDALPAGHAPLSSMRLGESDAYADIAFARNLGLIDYAGQRTLLRKRVAIPGMGGVGGAHLMALTRAGFGAFSLADFDEFSPVNANRQHGADLAGFCRPKLRVMAERALGVNPFLDLRCQEEALGAENLDEFLDGADILVDGLDFFVQDVRRLLFNRALERNIPVITAGPMGYSCALLVFMPGGPNYDAYFGVSDATPEMEQLIRFGLGLAPRGLHFSYMDKRFVGLRERRGPSAGAACQICAGITACEAAKIALGQKPRAVVPRSIQFDARRGKLRSPRLFMGMNSPWQRFKIWAAGKLIDKPPRLGAVPPDRPPEDFQEGLKYVIQAGIQAPSGDNVQPWKFRLDGNKLELLLDRLADQSFFNPRQTATLISAGAAVQNMTYAAGALRLDCAIELFPEGEGTDLAARLAFTPVEHPSHELMEKALWRRCTNRRPYSRKAVEHEVWERMSALANEDKDAQLFFCSSRAGLRGLARAVFLADRVRAERRDLHEHLMNLVHFEARTGSALCTGMPLKNLQAGLAGEIYLRAVRPWGRMRVAQKLGLGRMIPLYEAFCMYLSGGAGLVCARGAKEKDILKAGRAVQRVWCGLEHAGFAVQPMAALTLLHPRLNGGADLDPKHARLLEQAWSVAAGIFRVPEDALPLFMFRTGRAGPVRYGTYRLPAEDLLTPR